MTALDGIGRSELDVKESRDFALGPGPLRPRDAATLILLDHSGGETRVLMGKRASKHAFMPGKFVFPGGRTDPTDGRVKVSGALHTAVEQRIIGGTRITKTRARAIALSAIRETYEEAGLLIGTKGAFSTNHEGWHGFAEHEVQPNLEKLRFVARAITPPGRVRRYDTRFLAAWRDDVAVELPEGPTLELEELAWMSLAQARATDLPAITLSILSDLEERLKHDPDLSLDAPTPFYRMIRNRFKRDLV
ncbi:NUDIX domain-containing protein [Tianweitania populi]|uniref:NUDIX hydrolase n=1 Tax=Tianweitania populi TaxID=1607949 RepID=A0A8J3DTM1_9HYPH|nr:NUDIX domain-containing protein [Tianweitania populi]GHD09029.1 NUDIX hydrolase [Tianweitania populi]